MFFFFSILESSKEHSAEAVLTSYKSKHPSDKAKKKVADKQQGAVDKYSLIPEDFKYENKHYKYIKYTKNDAKSYKASKKNLHRVKTFFSSFSYVRTTYTNYEKKISRLVGRPTYL